MAPKVDKLAPAIAAANSPEIPNITLELKLGSGRACALLIPANLSPQEAIDLVGFIARDIPKVLLEAAMKAGAKALSTPNGLHVVPPA